MIITVAFEDIVTLSIVSSVEGQPAPSGYDDNDSFTSMFGL